MSVSQAQVQVQLCIDGRAVINGFCWEYSNALLQKLKELRRNGRVTMEKRPNSPTDIAISVITGLQNQMHIGSIGNFSDSTQVNNFIVAAEEFLDAFKVDPKADWGDAAH